MNTYEKCKAARRAILTASAEVMAYRKWSADFALEQITGLPDRLNSLSGINPSELTEEQMNELGFGKWSEDDPMMLIPLWLFPFISDEFECGCIDGTKSTMKKSDMDNDHRFGLLAYGVLPKDYIDLRKYGVIQGADDV